MAVRIVMGSKLWIPYLAALAVATAVVVWTQSAGDAGPKASPQLVGRWSVGEERIELRADGSLGDVRILPSLCGGEPSPSASPRSLGGSWKDEGVGDYERIVLITFDDFHGPGRSCQVPFSHMTDESGKKLVPHVGDARQRGFRRQ
ncbi:hypothetical protein [Kitasatospora griseola]|uniref:hypothetical protein n=1 Tax=Kitasatospora griseola TaxID=2064 RepID=UPI0016705AAA|nr:hypothetical protein [Kitasatospora griseola]GGR06873.1 hypothetical protein GCM10010195_72400 [Kitasatospora griseola]